MSKLKLQIQLDTDFEVDLSKFDFETMNEDEIKKELILDNHSKVMYDYNLIPKEEIRV